MNYDEIFVVLPKHNWTTKIKEWNKDKIHILANKTEKYEILEEIQSNLNKNKIGYTLDWLSLGFFIDEKWFLDKTKNKGLYRVSNCLDGKCTAEILIKHILTNCDLFCITKDNQKYLNSALNLCQLHPKLKELKYGIVQFISKNKDTVVKSLVAYIDNKFYEGQREQVTILNGDKYGDRFSNEDLAEGVSYIIFLFSKFIGLSDQRIVFPDPVLIESDMLERMVFDAATIRFIAEQEIFIESMHYQCLIEDERLVIRPSSIE